VEIERRDSLHGPAFNLYVRGLRLDVISLSRRRYRPEDAAVDVRAPRHRVDMERLYGIDGIG
jgi:hypothetical protein